MNETINIEDIHKYLSTVDLYICSASFESRSTIFTAAINKDIVNSATIFYNNAPECCFKENIQYMEAEWADKAHLVPVLYEDTSSTADTFSTYFKELFQQKKGVVLLDCTTFTHEGLLIVLRYLYEYREMYECLKVIYICAETYSNNTDNVKDKWLTKGISSIKTVLGYPGTFSPSKKNHLIILFGFELDRTIKLIDQMDFDNITLCFGSEQDSITTEHYKINKSRHEELLARYPNAKKLEISLRDHAQTEQVLLDYIKDDASNIVIAPMNNKISTIGVALATVVNPNIQVIYSKANEYNVSGYSTPADKAILFDVAW